MLPLLPGHYDHLFWGLWVRQACFSEPALQHAMIAVGALHESINARLATNDVVSTLQQRFCIQQYSKAIQQLTVNTTSSPRIELILTSCIIFVMFETLYGRPTEAFKHLKSGTAMLESWRPTTSSELMVKEEYLTPIFKRSYKHSDLVSMPAIFENLKTARAHLQVLLDLIYSSVNSAVVSEEITDIDARVCRAKHALEDWFDKFTKLKRPSGKEAERATILLRLQFETAMILLAAVQIDDECEFDKHIHSFRVVVNQCEQLVSVENDLTGRDTASPETFIYGFDLNVLPPLHITAFKCRDPALRRKAIALLDAGDRYEGLWNGKRVARFAQKTLEIEEAGLPKVTVCADIPRKNRVRLMALSYSPGFPGRRITG